MDLTALKAKRDKLDERIRKAETREQEHRQRHFLKLAKKHGLLQLDPPSLEVALAKVTAATESVTPSDTVATAVDTARTSATENVPETASDSSKKKWGWQ